MPAYRRAGELIAPAIHEFVGEDAAEGAMLIATLREYMASDLNAQRPAQNLHARVNTARYRLVRIDERTGCGLHKVGDLIEILIAARLGDAAARHGQRFVSAQADHLASAHNRGRSSSGLVPMVIAGALGHPFAKPPLRKGHR